MKNLANCTPKEFLVQTNRIRKKAEKWLKDIDLAGIRAKAPVLEEIKEGMSESEIADVMSRNKKALQEQALNNFSEILDGMLEKDVDGTLELLALVNFVDPKDVDNHSMAEYLTNVTELIQDEAVIGFFTSLMRLVQSNSSSVAKK